MNRIIIFLIISTLWSCGNGTCDDRRLLYYTKINGKILQKKITIIGGRPIEHFMIKNYNDSILDMNWISHAQYYDIVLVGDSVDKLDSSFTFTVLRNNEKVTKINFDFGCDYAQKEKK